MTCDEIADAIELIAAGELTADAAVSAHLSACGSCARSLDTARRLERLLRARPAPAAPAHFTSRLMSRIRRTSWRREQIVDWVFNGAMALAALLTVAGLWTALRRAGLSALNRDAMAILGAGIAAVEQKIAATLPLYAGATLLLVAALGVWWWAERESAI